MATLTGNTIASTYPLLLKIDSSGVDGTLRYVEDGDATDSTLKIANDAISIDATDKFYLDAGSDTYIHEVSTDKMDFVVGDQTILELKEAGGGASDSMSIQARNKFYLDGGDTTYIQESADGVMSFICDGRTMLTLTQGASGTGEVCINEGSNDDVDFRVESNAEDEALLVDADNNKLYINKGNASFETHIHSTNGSAAVISVTANGVIINDGHDASNDFRVEGDTNTHLLFCDAGSDEVGIGTSTPDYLLDVESTEATSSVARFNNLSDGASADILILKNAHASHPTNANTYVAFNDAGGTIDSLRGDGSGGVEETWTDSSDARIKENVNDLIGGLDKINALRPVSFNYTEDYIDGKVTKYTANDRWKDIKAGFIAQEFEAQLPVNVRSCIETVSEDITYDDTPKVAGDEIEVKKIDIKNNQVFQAYLVKAIQELSDKVTALENA